MSLNCLESWFVTRPIVRKPSVSSSTHGPHLEPGALSSDRWPSGPTLRRTRCSDIAGGRRAICSIQRHFRAPAGSLSCALAVSCSRCFLLCPAVVFRRRQAVPSLDVALPPGCQRQRRQRPARRMSRTRRRRTGSPTSVQTGRVITARCRLRLRRQPPVEGPNARGRDAIRACAEAPCRARPGVRPMGRQQQIDSNACGRCSIRAGGQPDFRQDRGILREAPCAFRVKMTVPQPFALDPHGSPPSNRRPSVADFSDDWSSPSGPEQLLHAVGVAHEQSVGEEDRVRTRSLPGSARCDVPR